MINKALGGFALGAALTLSAPAVLAQELAFATFIPAASPTITQVYQPWIDAFNEKHAADDVSF